MNYFELDTETRKLTLALRTRNSEIGIDLIENLRQQLTIEEVAGIIILSIESLLYWYDTDSVFWSMEYVIPADVMREIQKITSAAVCKRLISQGFMPGKDFSINADGKLLLNDQARIAVVAR